MRLPGYLVPEPADPKASSETDADAGLVRKCSLEGVVPTLENIWRVDLRLVLVVEAIPKRLCRKGDTRSKTFGLLKLPPVAPPRTLPRVAIVNGKPFQQFDTGDRSICYERS